MSTTNEGFSWRKGILTVIMLGVSILFLLPFIWMLVTSFKVEKDVFVYPIEWIPRHWNAVQNYKDVWVGDYPFWKYYLNSVKVGLTTTVISAIISALAAYGFSKIKFKGSNYVFLIVLATYMVPSQAILIPQFILYRQIGLFDSLLGLILLGSFSVLGTFMLRQFFMGVHQEFIESAKMDGANHFRIFWNIALPLVKPAVATYAILRFIWTWNDYQGPLIFSAQRQAVHHSARDAEIYLAERRILLADHGGRRLGDTAALIVFIIGQKSVIDGIALGGVKG